MVSLNRVPGLVKQNLRPKGPLSNSWNWKTPSSIIGIDTYTINGI